MAQQKLYVVQKMIYARSIAEALRREKKAEVQQVFLDDDWKKNMLTIEQFPKPPSAGFAVKPKKKNGN